MGIEVISIGLAVSATVAAVAQLVGYEQAQRRKKRAPTLEDRISDLAKNLEIASSTISEIENEISKRREMAEKLREDAQYYEQLRELNKAQIEVVASALRGDITRVEKHSRYINAAITFGIAFLFFMLGLTLGQI